MRAVGHTASHVITDTALKFKKVSLQSCRNIISLMDVSFPAGAQVPLSSGVLWGSLSWDRHHSSKKWETLST